MITPICLGEHKFKCVHLKLCVWENIQPHTLWQLAYIHAMSLPVQLSSGPLPQKALAPCSLELACLVLVNQ